MDGPRPLAQIDQSWWLEKGVLSALGVDHHVYREGVMSGDFILQRGGSVLARATKPSAFRRAFVLTYNETPYTLRAKSAFRRTFLLLDGTEQIGSIVPHGALTRRATVQLPDEWPFPVKAFAIWLTIILWKRDADAAASSG